VRPAELVVLSDRSGLIRRVRDDVTNLLDHLLAVQPDVHLCLTGGTVGIAVLNELGTGENSVDWSRVHLWWSDERWLPRGDPERNAQQARGGFIKARAFPSQNVHEMPAAEEEMTLDEAALAYAQELRGAGIVDGVRGFDLSLLGVGADGHVASLFPGRLEDLASLEPVLAVRHSPKPPPERISLSLATLNASQRIWIAASGEDKRAAITASQALLNDAKLPGTAVRGHDETRIYCDADGAPLPSEQSGLRTQAI